MLKRSPKERRKWLAKLHKAVEGLDAYACILDELLSRERLRSVSIGGQRIHVRTSSTDLDVAVSVFHDKEYDHISCINPGFIIDAGAYIGATSLFFATKFPEAQIIAIEPEACNFDMLLKNTSGFTNIHSIRAALWGSIGRRSIHNRFTGYWGYTISDTHNQTESIGQGIDCVTIESLIHMYGMTKIDVLKMDIEGSEKNVLEHSSDWIDLVDTLIVELHDRIHAGCESAFLHATKDFKSFERHVEKVIAFRH